MSTQFRLILILFISLLLFVIIEINNELLNGADSKITYWLNTHRIDGFDSIINVLSNLASPVIIASIIILYLRYLKDKNIQFLNASKKLLFAFVLCASLTFVIKNIVCRIRPFTVNSSITKLGSGGSYSFPSGHTADAFTLFFSMLLLFPQNKKLHLLSLGWALFIAYSRMYLGVHYITDILGSLLLSWISVYIIHKQIGIKKAE